MKNDYEDFIMNNRQNKDFDAFKMKRTIVERLSKKITAADGSIDMDKLKKLREQREQSNQERKS